MFDKFKCFSYQSGARRGVHIKRVMASPTSHMFRRADEGLSLFVRHTSRCEASTNRVNVALSLSGTRVILGCGVPLCFFSFCKYILRGACFGSLDAHQLDASLFMCIPLDDGVFNGFTHRISTHIYATTCILRNELHIQFTMSMCLASECPAIQKLTDSQ